ncbi:MAG: cadmium-translocating P-type ATPase [Leptospiraceae bacterium]|nr:cadmium-translocating P-type ATPase [Leptospiraceae bacterium]
MAVSPSQKQKNGFRSCFHCGESIPQDVSSLFEIAEPGNGASNLHFCCGGCKSAWQIIHGSGLDNYYSLRTEFAPKVNQQSSPEPYEIWESRFESDSEGFTTGKFLLQGIHCASCVWLNEKVLSEIPGVQEVSAQLSTGRVKIRWNKNQVSLRKIAESAARLGYRLLYVNAARAQNQNSLSGDLLRKMSVAGFFTGNIMLISISLYAGFFSGMDLHTRNLFHLTSFVMATITLFYSGSAFFKNTWAALRNGVLSMDILTAAGLSLAYLYSVYITFKGKGEVYFDGVCFVTFAILTGRFLESRLRQRALTTVENLTRSLPQSAHLFKDGVETEVPLESVGSGDTIIIKPGETVPLDGVLLDTSAQIDESLLTGEYLPVEKKQQEKIVSGSVCLENSITLQVISITGKDTLSQIAARVEDALGKETGVSKLTSRIARYFIAFVLVSSVATFTFWYFYMSAGSAVAVLHTVSLLIVACPCALNLAVPAALLAGMQRAFEKGALLQSGSAMENLAQMNVLCFDKTGTLTTGKLSLQDIEFDFENEFSKDTLLALSKSISVVSGVVHPVSAAFRSLEAGSLPVETVKHFAGQGLQARVNGQDWLLGSTGFLEQRGIRIHFQPRPGETCVGLAVLGSQKQAALFWFNDELRKETKSAVEYFSGFCSTTMLTGDLSESARYFAEQAGITHYLARQSPADKTLFIQNSAKSRGKGHKQVVGFIGDGLNDAEALAVADVAISLAEASQLSVYAADILLLNNSLMTLVELHKTALNTRRIIRQNLIFSFVYNFSLLPLAFAGVIIPLVGAIAMASSSILVLLNSLRMMRK